MEIVDGGWWILAQYHKKHKIITVCIADNGIGIRNSLMSGSQQSDIFIKNISSNDGEFIRMALEKPISGSLEPPLRKKGIIRKTFVSGARKGNGLKRIKKICEDLKIPFVIMSHNGYAFMNRDGGIGAKSSRVFAGTMYQFTIPAKEEEIYGIN